MNVSHVLLDNKRLNIYYLLDEKPFHCTLCNTASFTRIQRLNRHIREKHPGARAVNVNTYQPPPFSKKPKPRVTRPLVSRKSRKTPSTTVKIEPQDQESTPAESVVPTRPRCKICGRSFKHIYSLNSHMRKHRGRSLPVYF